MPETATPTIDDLRQLFELASELVDAVYQSDDRLSDLIDDQKFPSADAFTDMAATLRTLAEDHAERKARDRFEDAGGFQITPRAA